MPRMSQWEFDAHQRKVAAMTAPKGQPVAADAVEREATLHDDILDYCKRQDPPWLVIHSRMDCMTTTDKGVPDFVLLRDATPKSWIALMFDHIKWAWDTLLHGEQTYQSFGVISTAYFVQGVERILFIECKSKTGKCTTEQLGWHMMAERLGYKVHIVRSMSEFEAIAKG